jgi:type IV pilus assembly protein PilA
MKNQKGFTLIELMIVVAIIAILAAIAIPQYNDYTARAQLSEATTLLDGVKTPIASQFSEADEAASCALPTGTVTAGKYVASIAAAAASPCVITATMKTGISAKASGKMLTMTYTPGAASGVNPWVCAAGATAPPTEVLPKACQPDAAP